MKFQNPKNLIYITSHRNLLEYKLKELFSRFKNLNKKEIVDFGCGGKPRYKYLAPNAKWYFFDKNPKLESIKYSNAKDIPIKKADIFMSIEVLQYLDFLEIEFFFEEVSRIINNNGLGIISIPYLYPIDHKENFRVSIRYLKSSLLKENIDLEIIEIGNFISLLHDLLFSKIYYVKFIFIKKFFLSLIMPLKYVAIIFERFKIFRLPSGYILLLKSKV